MSSHSNLSTFAPARRARSAARALCAVVIVLLVGAASPAYAATATVTALWNPNTESNVAGYKLSFGTQSGVYTTVIDVGNVTTWLVPNLTAGQRYFFAVQAYDTSALLSPFSTEVIYDAPGAATITSLSPTSAPI